MFFKRIDVENFKNVKETEECLLKPIADKEKRAFDRACIAGIHAIANGTPYEINLIAHHMYRKWKDGKNSKIALSPAVWDEVLKEIDGLRKSGRYQVANKMRGYGSDLLKVLISLLEFPNVSKEWLSEFMLLEGVDAGPKEIRRKKSIARSSIEQLKKDRVLSEEDARLCFNGSPFDVLYLKYLCASKGVMDTEAFSMSLSEDPIFILYRKLTDTIFLKDFPEYYIQTRLDKKEKVKGEKTETFIIGSRVPNLPPEPHTLLEISPESRNGFYLGVPHSLRYRVNIEWMKQGFVTQVKFQKEEDKERFRNRLKALADRLNFLGYKIHMAQQRSGIVEAGQNKGSCGMFGQSHRDKPLL
jgi:hypothetical protein